MSRKVAELRKAGERREIVFGIRGENGEMSRNSEGAIVTSICTGVPRADGGISTIKAEDPPKPRYEKPEPLPVRPARVMPDMTEAKKIMATIAPRDERDCGVVFFGSYKVEGGQVHVADQDGRSLGSLPVGPDDDVEAVARRLLREKTAVNSDFFGRINYRKTSLV